MRDDKEFTYVSKKSWYIMIINKIINLEQKNRTILISEMIINYLHLEQNSKKHIK